MRTIWIPHSTIPAEQVPDGSAQPDATAQSRTAGHTTSRSGRRIGEGRRRPLRGVRRRSSGPTRRSRVRADEGLGGGLSTMYTYIVDRTQIYLTPEESAALERASIATGKTKSQLIREAIDEKYGAEPSLEEFMSALNAAAGIWANPEGEAAVKAIHAGRRAEARQTRQRLRALQSMQSNPGAPDLDDASGR